MEKYSVINVLSVVDWNSELVFHNVLYWRKSERVYGIYCKILMVTTVCARYAVWTRDCYECGHPGVDDDDEWCTSKIKWHHLLPTVCDFGSWAWHDVMSCCLVSLSWCTESHLILHSVEGLSGACREATVEWWGREREKGWVQYERNKKIRERRGRKDSVCVVEGQNENQNVMRREKQA